MRLELTRRSELAVRALCRLAAGGRTKGAELAEKVGTSPAFLAQVLSPLVRAGWVRSDRGPTGGYELATSLDRLSVLALVEEIEGPTDDGRCVLRGGPCAEDGAVCALHDAWVPARDSLLARLAATSVAAAGCRD